MADDDTAELDYVHVIQRLGATVGDGADTDDNPDFVPVTAGQVIFAPTQETVKVQVGGRSVSVESATIACEIDSYGYLTYNGKRGVWLVDLGSDKVAPNIPRDQAAYMVQYRNLKFADQSFQKSPVYINPSTGSDFDITDATSLPIPSGTTLAYLNAQVDKAIAAKNELLDQKGVPGGIAALDPDSGDVLDADGNPVTAGLGDTQIAGLIDNPDSATGAALSAYSPDHTTVPVVRLGVFPDSANSDSITEYNTAAGEPATAVNVAYNYTMQPDTAVLDAHQQAGREPIVTWMPNGASEDPDDNTDLQLADITAGNWDTYMTQFLTAIKGLGYPVMIRWGHEMNGDWYAWSEQVNGNQPGQFVQAWKHVVDLARSLDVTNARWMWCPTTDFPGSPSLTDLYPGDDYVDVIGVDGYNWGADGPDGVRSPDTVFTATFTDIATFTVGKPLWIAETGAQDTDGDKPQWISDFFTLVDSLHLAGFVWFNADVTEPSGQFDWRVNSSSQAAAAFTAGMATLRESTRPSGDVTVAAASRDTVWHGTQDFTTANVVGLPTNWPTPDQIGAAPAVVPINYFTDDYTLAAWNAGTQVTFDGADPQTLTVPPDSTVNFPKGTTIDIAQSGAGAVTITAGAGVTLNSRGGLTNIAGQYGIAALRKMAPDVWYLYGDLA